MLTAQCDPISRTDCRVSATEWSTDLSSLPGGVAIGPRQNPRRLPSRMLVSRATIPVLAPPCCSLWLARYSSGPKERDRKDCPVARSKASNVSRLQPPLYGAARPGRRSTSPAYTRNGAGARERRWSAFSPASRAAGAERWHGALGESLAAGGGPASAAGSGGAKRDRVLTTRRSAPAALLAAP